MANHFTFLLLFFHFPTNLLHLLLHSIGELAFKLHFSFNAIITIPPKFLHHQLIHSKLPFTFVILTYLLLLGLRCILLSSQYQIIIPKDL